MGEGIGEGLLYLPSWVDLPYVYIAGPYSCCDTMQNIRSAIEAADQVLDLNALPYIPHLTGFWHLVSPKSYQFWLWFDKRWLMQCDVVYRLPGESKGADAEEEWAAESEIPVAHSLNELKAILPKLPPV